MTPQRIQLKKNKRWKMPANTVRVDRSTTYKNPYQAGNDGDGDAAYLVELFEEYCTRDSIGEAFQERIRRELRGKNLACFCPLDQPCHADVLLKLANKEE